MVSVETATVRIRKGKKRLVVAGEGIESGWPEPVKSYVIISTATNPADKNFMERVKEGERALRARVVFPGDWRHMIKIVYADGVFRASAYQWPYADHPNFGQQEKLSRIAAVCYNSRTDEWETANEAGEVGEIEKIIAHESQARQKFRMQIISLRQGVAEAYHDWLRNRYDPEEAVAA